MWWKKRACGWSNQNCKFNPSNLVIHYTTSSLVLSTHLVNCAVTCWHEWLIVKSHGSNLLYLGMKTTFHMPCWCQIFFFWCVIFKASVGGGEFLPQQPFRRQSANLFLTFFLFFIFDELVQSPTCFFFVLFHDSKNQVSQFCFPNTEEPI